MKPRGVLAVWPSRLRTWTEYPPAAFAGVRAVTRVGLTTLTLVAGVPPISTAAPETKPVPVTVIVVPPEVGPLSGDTDAAVNVPLEGPV